MQADNINKYVHYITFLVPNSINDISPYINHTSFPSTHQRNRFEALTSMSEELSSENFHRKDDIAARQLNLLQKWKELIDSLDKKKRTLTGFSELLGMFREIETIQAKLQEMKVYIADKPLYVIYINHILNLLHY